MGSVIRHVADNIISPLGFTTADNMAALLDGWSALRLYERVFDLPEPFVGSLFDRVRLEALAEKAGIDDTHTLFEKACILAAFPAIEASGADVTDGKTLFVLSTTKGNIELLEDNPADWRCYLYGSALKVARFFGNSTPPVVVSNACISGVSAQMAAARLLMSGVYDRAVVIGADLLSRFIVSGFQSFKALSLEPCRPYDAGRSGLNLGEAAGAMILERRQARQADGWYLEGMSAHNDANHISGPSRTAEGAYRVLEDLKRSADPGELAFVSAHGTATPYNDQMEAIALQRAALDHVPLTGLKGFFGHTLGAAGVIETILAMKAVDAGIVLPTRGYRNQGTTCPLNVSDSLRQTSGTTFIKILSGFGGCNAGVVWQKGEGR